MVWENAFKFDHSFDRHTEYSKRYGVSEAFAESYAAWTQTGGAVAKATALPEDYAYNMSDVARTFKVVQEVIDSMP